VAGFSKVREGEEPIVECLGFRRMVGATGKIKMLYYQKYFVNQRVCSLLLKRVIKKPK